MNWLPPRAIHKSRHKMCTRFSGSFELYYTLYTDVEPKPFFWFRKFRCLASGAMVVQNTDVLDGLLWTIPSSKKIVDGAVLSTSILGDCSVLSTNCYLIISKYTDSRT